MLEAPWYERLSVVAAFCNHLRVEPSAEGHRDALASYRQAAAFRSKIACHWRKTGTYLSSIRHFEMDWLSSTESYAMTVRPQEFSGTSPWPA